MNTIKISDVLYFAGHFFSFTVYMACVNSIINPFVYVIQYHEFQNRTKEIFCGKKKEFGESGSVSTAMTEDAKVKEIA